jgi:hypothetical protein
MPEHGLKDAEYRASMVWCQVNTTQSVDALFPPFLSYLVLHEQRTAEPYISRNNI